MISYGELLKRYYHLYCTVTYIANPRGDKYHPKSSFPGKSGSRLCSRDDHSSNAVWYVRLGHQCLLKHIYQTFFFLYPWFLAPILERRNIRMLFAGFIFPFLLASIVNAAPGLELVQPSKRQSITPLSSAQISSFTPFTFFASTAYCNPSTTINFSCGGTFLQFFRFFFLAGLDLGLVGWHRPFVNNSKLRCKPGLHPNGIGRRRWLCAIL